MPPHHLLLGLGGGWKFCVMVVWGVGSFSGWVGVVTCCTVVSQFLCPGTCSSCVIGQGMEHRDQWYVGEDAGILHRVLGGGAECLERVCQVVVEELSWGFWGQCPGRY